MPSKTKQGPAACSLAMAACAPCKGGVPPLKGAALKDYARQIGAPWRVVKGHHLEAEYAFKDFARALVFTNRVGALAERVNHHPDIYLAWGRVRLTLWTHKVDGLTASDFVFAAKIGRLRR
jgi:4a-hydroxytetrahydrobiopterin dehydratase